MAAGAVWLAESHRRYAMALVVIIVVVVLVLIFIAIDGIILTSYLHIYTVFR